jgi:FG-GAP-like repeat
MRLLVVLLSVTSSTGLLAQTKFETQEIDATLKIGYAVITTDVDGDKKPDIVVVDQHKIVWYQNPTWQKRVMLDGQTKPDNVSIAAMDIDGDGLPEFVIGAAWKPFDTKTPGTLQWIRRGKTLDDPWTMFAIPNEEPTIHRLRAIDLDGDGQAELVSVPLMGREATKEQNWADGRPLRITSYKIPAKPEVPANWKPVVMNADLHVAHNFDALPKSRGLLVASYEGISELTPKAGGWDRILRHEANQANAKSNRGASEIRLSAKGLIATIEPWHGSQVVVYTPDANNKLSRNVIDEELRWGHAVAWADVDGTGREALIVGIRDDHPTAKRGVRLYRQDTNNVWQRELLDAGGVAVEDLTIADLNSDGKPDIIAVGRATGNVRIYWNRS